MRFSDVFEDEISAARAILEASDPPKKDEKKKDKKEDEDKESTSKSDKEEMDPDSDENRDYTKETDEKKEGPKDDSEDDGAEEKETADDTGKSKEDDNEDRQDEKGEKNFGDKDGGKDAEGDPDDDDGDDTDEDEEEAPVTGKGPKTKVVIDPPLKQEKSEDGVKEEHLGFKKLEGKLKHEKGVYNPAGLAAAIGRKKYGKKGMEAKAHQAEEVVNEGITAHLKKHDKVVDTLRKLRDRHDDRAAKKFSEKIYHAGSKDEFDVGRYTKAKAREAWHRSRSRKHGDTLEKLGVKD